MKEATVRPQINRIALGDQLIFVSRQKLRWI
jgi:hypothetical protein